MVSTGKVREKIAWREVVPSIFLVFNSFVWYILTYNVFCVILNELNLMGTEKLELFTIYYTGAAVSAILGSKLFPRARTKFLELWLFTGAIMTLFLTAISSNGILANALIAFFLGVSIGIGLPSCLTYFADATTIENRGFTGGVIWSFVGFSVLILALLINMLGLLETIVTLTIWRLFGGVGFIVLSKEQKTIAVQKSPSYWEIIRKKGILLYLFPWIMFSLVNFAEAPILETVFGAEFFAFVLLLEYAFIGIFAIIGGIIADIAGRKRVVITGFVMLGIEYAALSVFSISHVAWYLFLILDGITWGLFSSVFFMALWGDLGENFEKEKYYALGGLPFLLASFVSILISPYAYDIPRMAAFSFASFFLFLAVLPLMYAPETLPEKTMRDRELKEYIEKAKKKAKGK